MCFTLRCLAGFIAYSFLIILARHDHQSNSHVERSKQARGVLEYIVETSP